MGNTLTNLKTKTIATHSSPSTMDAAESLVTNAVTKHPVVIFSKTYCPFCHSAKDDIALAAEKIANPPTPVIYELDTMGEQGYAIQAHLAERTGRRTVPNVFIGGRSVGGGDDVAAFARRGVLVQMLTQAPQQLSALQDEQAPRARVVSADGGGRNDECEEGDGDMRTVKEEVDALIESAKVIVFSKSTCPFCLRAKKLLEDVGAGVADYTGATVVEMDEKGQRGYEMQQYLLQRTGQRTVPNIFIAGAHVGGCDDLMSLAQDGRLSTALESAFAPSVEKTSDEEGDEVGADADGEAAIEQEGGADGVDGIETEKEAVFGAGCFWGVELAFQRVAGVTRTQVGYSNGNSDDVTYDDVCSGTTGAAEVVRVTYDETKVSFEELLKVWEDRHDPTSLNMQGNDEGTQYRSAVFYTDEGQREAVEKWKRAAEERIGGAIVTDIAKVDKYVEAEEYHQRYLQKGGQSAEKGATEEIRCYG